MAKTITGIDAGVCGVRALQAGKSGDSLKVLRFYAGATPANSDPAAALAAASTAAGWKFGDSRIGLTGRDLVLRYTKVPPVPEAQLRNLIKFEVEDLNSQSGGDLASDFNLLPIPTDFSGEDTVLLALAKNNLLDLFLAVQNSGLRVQSFTPNSIALYNAYLRYGKPGQETVLIANLGHENVDLALVSGSDLVFARNLAGGGSALTEAIASRFNVSAQKAEPLKKELADIDPGKKTRPNAFASPQHEKVTNAVLGAAGQIPSMLQSTVLFAKTQTKMPDLKLGKVLLCGGGARLKGLPEYLTAAMGVPVALFDPFEEADLSALTDADARLLDENRYESVVALGLAAGALDPGLYSIEILPESLHKKREFASKTVYLALAGVAMAAYLGADFFVTKTRANEARMLANDLHRKAEARKRRDKEVKEGLEEIESLSIRGRLLEQKAGVGSAFAKTLRLLQDELPRELWVSGVSVELSDRKDADLKIGDDKVPIVRVEGRGREGVGGLKEIFPPFVEKIRAQVPQAAMKSSTSTARGFSFVLEINFFAREGA